VGKRGRAISPTALKVSDTAIVQQRLVFIFISQ